MNAVGIPFGYCQLKYPLKTKQFVDQSLALNIKPLSACSLA